MRHCDKELASLTMVSNSAPDVPLHKLQGHRAVYKKEQLCFALTDKATSLFCFKQIVRPFFINHLESTLLWASQWQIHWGTSKWQHTLYSLTWMKEFNSTFLSSIWKEKHLGKILFSPTSWEWILNDVLSATSSVSPLFSLLTLGGIGQERPKLTQVPSF